MNIEITDELAIELADAHAATFAGAMNYGDLVAAVGKLLVHIPDPRAPQPIDIPVEVLVLDPSATPAPKRPVRLTKHQGEVYDDIMRMSRRLRGGERSYVWVDGRNIGSKGACIKLVEKGWIEVKFNYGPRGGEFRYYRPIINSSTEMSTPVDSGGAS